MVQIEILTGPESGKVVDIGGGTHVLGRAKGNEVVLDDGSVSGRHLELMVGEDGSARFRDLGSTNGTWSGGVQVQDGEWFVGTELKLGGCVLRLVDPSGAADDADAALHRRAREAALSGGRRGGPLQLALVVVLLVAAAGAAWWVLRGDGEGEDPVVRAGGPGEGAGAQVRYDLIDNLGDFASPDSWTLGSGLVIESGSLRADGSRARAVLARNLPAVAAVALSGTCEGVTVVPVVAWGMSGSEVPVASWASAPLSSEPSVLPLPPSADWFRIELEVSGRGTLRGLVVDVAEGAPSAGSAPAGRTWTVGGNWLLEGSQGLLLAVRGDRGSWQTAEGGVDFAAEGGADLLVRAGDALLTEGSFQVLGGGGPVGLASGVVVEESPGLLIGGETGRYLLRFDPPARVLAGEGGAVIVGLQRATLRWDLQTDLVEAARLSRSLADFERRGDDRALLQGVARLLRDYPLVEAQVIDALARSRASMERGRTELARLQTATGAALFVASLEGMEDLSAQAAGLAARSPGTDLDREAGELADVLGTRAREVRAERDAAAAAYRTRLVSALQGSYPLLATWLEEKQP